MPVATAKVYRFFYGRPFFVYLFISVMAPAKGKSKSASVIVRIAKPKVRRKGVHAKTKTSKLKQSKNYKKLSRGQG